MRRIGLVGCVKQKATVSRRAEDLYESALLAGRRAYVRRSCEEWWILSALHGLVAPDELLDPYDFTVKSLGRASRRQWSSRVLDAIDERIDPPARSAFEIHAGSEYRDFGLVEGLARRGHLVEVPTMGMKIGEQLSFYTQAARGG